MKNNKKFSVLTKRYMRQYLLTLAGTAAGLLAIIVGADWFLGSVKVWHWEEPLYRFFRGIKDNLFVIVPVTVFVIWSIVTYFFMIRPLRYIDRIVGAAKRLTEPTEEQIVLPRDLSEAQIELNAAREAALRNASLAKEAEKRKNDMIVYLAHDLKTPLTSVIGYLSLLNDEPSISDENRAKYTAVALDRSKRLEELINEFFDITRFSLTTLTLETQRIDLSLMLNQTISEFLPILSEHSLTANADIQPNVELLCDPDKLERVFDNLLRNAVNYSYPDTAVDFSMTADDSSVTVVCRNRGRTIPKEKLDRVFEQFFRADYARQSKTGGAGLGLAIAKEIVVLHGGTISAVSADEVIEFTVTLPRTPRHVQVTDGTP